MNKTNNPSYPRNTMEQARLVFGGWEEFKDQLNVPNLSLNDFQKMIKEVEKKIEQVEKVRIKRSAAVETRNRALEDLWKLTKRVRNLAKATFGDNSKEIEEFGGRPVRFQKLQ